MRVYVIRHGESENNRAKRWSGWCDTPLTDKGRADAARAGERLRGIVFDKIYASDLSRARETAAVALPDGTAEPSVLLREINVGRLENTPHTPELLASTAGEYAAFGGESNEDLRGRIRRFMTELETAAYDTVAVFTHGGWMRAMLSVVLEANIPATKLPCGNGTVAIFDYTNGSWKLHSWINLL